MGKEKASRTLIIPNGERIRARGYHKWGVGIPLGESKEGTVKG